MLQKSIFVAYQNNRVMKRGILIVAAIATLFVLTSCKKDKEEQVKQEKSCENVHWDYKGEEGAENWGTLCTGFADCDGEEQSPIDIVTEKVVKDEKAVSLEFQYENTPVSIINNGHTIQFNVKNGSFLKIGEEVYELLQFHYHTASEHTVNAKHYPMEVHFVHKGTKGLAVVGMFFEEGESNVLLENYLADFPKKKGEYTADKTLPLGALVPQDLSYFHYDGSLTTPPCSEIVDWYVLQKPLTASKEQLAKMAELLHDNFRPVQPLNGREITCN